ncbi:thiamine biosynthesis lipoprotein [Nakamurella panacisegetis]|uniref:FAD:protein FMN transferase n=1 Tax=Nakamurella panacisegetis TaxID=1090615 RepID=A0A1H0JW01_9ACTN|nr:FAD:protein FMN transferase [Nakamurella panacisegetis]SDO47784.1 thiamine biosynthesis lipoprotein [Nakamurella panacisegetis]
MNPTSGRVDFEIWSTTATLVVTDPAALGAARAELDDELGHTEVACSRFRADSEINALLRSPGRRVSLSPTLNDAMAAALRIASATSYLVDPTVAAAVIALGYDRDIALLGDIAGLSDLVDRGIGEATATARPAPGAWRVEHDHEAATVTVPAGVGLDLGATAKAFAADRAAVRIHSRLGCGVLVSLGGDISVAGPAPDGGWSIAIADDHRTAEADPQTTVAISSGGLATSSITARRWRTPVGVRHHLVDPRTGENPAPLWRSASVAAGSAVDANAGATAAIILGDQAPVWLAERRLPSRLVRIDGSVVAVAGWPADQQRAA